MNPFLDSQAQRNTPRGCGFAGACQKLSLLPRKQSKLNQRSRPGRPTRWRRRIRSSRGRNPKWVEKRVQSGGLRSRGLVEPHTAPIAARSSTGSRFCTPLQPPGTTAALAPPPRALAAKAQHSLAAARDRASDLRRASARTEAALAAAAHRPAHLPRSPAPATASAVARTQHNHGRHVEALGRGPTFC